MNEILSALDQLVADVASATRWTQLLTWGAEHESRTRPDGVRIEGPGPIAALEIETSGRGIDVVDIELAAGVEWPAADEWSKHLGAEPAPPPPGARSRRFMSRHDADEVTVWLFYDETIAGPTVFLRRDITG